MEIDDKVVNVVRTCLTEMWNVEEVTDDMVKSQIEMTLLVAVLYDLDTHHCPKTIDAMTQYYKDKGITVGEDDEDAESSEETAEG